MTVGSIITIIVVIAAVYFLIKFIVNPLVKIISGIVIILAIVYVLQNFFNADLNRFLGPLSPYLDFNKLSSFINGIIGPIAPFFNFFKSIIPR